MCRQEKGCCGPASHVTEGDTHKPVHRGQEVKTSSAQCVSGWKRLLSGTGAGGGVTCWAGKQAPVHHPAPVL